MKRQVTHGPRKRHRTGQVNKPMSALEFFKCLYGQESLGYLTIWTKSDSRTHWHPASQLESAAEMAITLAETMDVYYGVGLRKKELPEHQRGKAEDVLGIPGLWLDVDVADEAHHQKDLPGSKDEAEELIRQFALPPSLLVNTGHGLHAYWLFKQPWLFLNDTERAGAQTLLTQFQQTFQALARTKGWRIDTTSDLPRVLRVPGTHNYKSERLPVVVKPQQDIRRYDPGDFEPYLVLEHPGEDLCHPVVDSDVQAEALPRANLILAGCEFLRHCRDDARELSEPHWFAMASNLARTDGGFSLVHQLSEPYPGYTKHETDAKIQHALADTGPHTCKWIADQGGETWCQSCPHRDKIASPIALGRVPWHSSIELLQMTPPKVDWLIEEVVPAESVILLGGREGSMKTWLAMECAHAVAEGRAWLSRTTKQGKVLYIDAEMPGNLFTTRLSALGGLDGLDVWRWQDKYFPESLMDRQLNLAAHEYQLIIVDTLRRFMGKKDENSATEMAAITRGLRELTRWGATVIALHHAPKDAERGDAYRGSTELGAGVDIVYSLRKTENTLRLRTAKTRCGSELDLTICVDKTETRPIFSDAHVQQDAAHQSRLQNLQSVILDLRREHGARPTQSEIVLEASERGLGCRATILENLQEGAGQYWQSERQGRGRVYDVSICPKVEGPDISDRNKT